MFYLCENNINRLRQKVSPFSFSKLLLQLPPSMTTSPKSQLTHSSDATEESLESLLLCPVCREENCTRMTSKESPSRIEYDLSGPHIPMRQQFDILQERMIAKQRKQRRVAREFSGLQPSPEMIGQSQQPSPLASSGSKGSLKGASPGSSIGSSSLQSGLRRASQGLRRSLGISKGTSSSHVQKKLKVTAGKMTLQSDTDLNLEQNPFVLTKKQIGSLSGKQDLITEGTTQLKGTSLVSPQLFEWRIIGPYAQLVHTILLLTQFETRRFTTSGGQLTLGSHTGHGVKQEWMLIARIRGPSGGMVIKVNEMLLWMNFEEELISHISSVGSTGIQLLWKSKDLLSPSTSIECGLPVICPLKNFTTTIQKWTKPSWMLFDDV